MFPPKMFLKRFCDEHHYQNVHIVHSPRSATFLVSLAKLTPNDCAVVIPEPALPPPSPCPASPNSENPLLLVLFAEPIIERLASSLSVLESLLPLHTDPGYHTLQ